LQPVSAIIWSMESTSISWMVLESQVQFHSLNHCLKKIAMLVLFLPRFIWRAVCFFFTHVDQEIGAIECLFEALGKKPLSYGLLLTQIDFLRSKKMYKMALKLAKLAVTYSPSEYKSWAKLTQIYIDLEDFDSVCLIY
jgi:tetratricopeptide (TPR) repeat protein